MATVKTRNPDGRQTAYITWYLSEYRNPRTKSEWAAAHDLNKDTITEWERSDWFVSAIDAHGEQAKAVWSEALASLRVVVNDPRHHQFVAAFDKLAKLLGKYPSDKVEVTTVERVAYVQPHALRDLAADRADRPN